MRSPQNISATDLEATKDFFVRILGLVVGVDTAPGSDTGPLDHFAFRGDDMEGLVSRLEAEAIEHRVSIVPGSGRRQVFLRGPEDVKIEVGFPPA